MKKHNKTVGRTVFVAAALAANVPAWALGGLDQARSVAEDVKTGLYALLGVACLIYLIYLAFMAITEKKTWADFGWGVVYVAIAGATLALGGWAWSMFSS